MNTLLYIIRPGYQYIFFGNVTYLYLNLRPGLQHHKYVSAFISQPIDMRNETAAITAARVHWSYITFVLSGELIP